MNENIILQSIAGVFLKHDDRYLLMKRSSERKIAPGVWSCVGGHIEPHEQNNPMSACLREIYEETGIPSNHIFDLKLRYIIIRRTKDTIRQSFIYFGATGVSDLTCNDEGTLHWIPESELLDREFSKTFAAMMKHYLNTPDEKKRVVVGVADNVKGGLRMNWSAVEDFES